ncbi:hypothetical protein [Pseudobacteriovorax antillogorgiicola]|uniref:DNA alkylation repair enzyme n=1 Tax=Pseudobacteriovorax antillogorgiicola TaxID=1513793 RepID=A0A1Y6C1T1_9BACT|nr:hypothetical protein [Pseudobacteriovorax antillogorgiicola]TCS50736.1 hypothetical protein EDD56_112119 [Pseudobacteriovorax antillogorgiicola]SMF40979.1 hypothetical protein SAMN06296036_112118 [Pseudobacteriovorax antillogorgiicola]
MTESICEMLAGGHPNSLGRTEEVVKLILKNPERIDELYQGYNSDDEVVRLRISSSFKRLFLAHPDWFKKWYPKFSKRVMRLQQPSALWTYSLLCFKLEEQLSAKNKEDAVANLKEILKACDDWIVINNTIETLGHWAADDAALRRWLKPMLESYTEDSRKSVAKRAFKIQKSLGLL